MIFFIIYAAVAALICLPLSVGIGKDCYEEIAIAVLFALFGWLVLPIIILIGFYRLIRRVISK